MNGVKLRSRTPKEVIVFLNYVWELVLGIFTSLFHILIVLEDLIRNSLVFFIIKGPLVIHESKFWSFCRIWQL